MFFQTQTQLHRARTPRGVARRYGDVHGRQRMLIQPKRFPGEALDAIARHRAAEGARRDRQPQTRMIFVIGQHGQTEESIGKFLTALSDLAKFGRLVQTLARLEGQLTNRWTACRAVLGTEALTPLRATPCQQTTATLGGHPGPKAMGSGTVQITGIERTFHSATSRHLSSNASQCAGFAKGGKGTEHARTCQ